jgi:LPS export ABC transporter protein LptC
VRRALVLGAALLAAAACRDDRKTAPPIVAPSPAAAMLDSADQVAFGVRYGLTDAGVKRGELFADTAYIFDETTRFEFRKVRVEFNTALGVKDGVLTAKRGLYNTRFGMLEGYGDVVVTTTDGKKLSSPELKYNQATNQITTDSAFVFDDGKFVQRGIGLVTDPRLTRVQINRASSGVARRVPVPAGRP